MNGVLTLENLHGMLTLKQAELKEHVATEQARLVRIEARLRQIELEETMSQYEVILKVIPNMTVVSRRITIPTNNDVPDYLNPAFMEVWEHIKANNGDVAGTQFTIWHQAPDVLTNEVVDAIVPIKNTLPATDRIDVYDLEETQVASAVHHGDFEDFTQLHTAILQWTEANGYEPVGGYREIYIMHNPDDYSDSTTEVQFPVKRVKQS